MLKTTIGRLAVNSGLPPELQGLDEVLDKKGLENLLKRAEALGPDTYREVAQHLLQVGKHAAQLTGGNSFGTEHLRLSVAGRRAQHELVAQIKSIYSNKKLDEAAKSERIVNLLSGAGDKLTDDVLRESLSEHNPFGMQIISGARGNPTNLRSLRAGDLLYVDHRNRPIPLPILHSYSQGLSPAEYFAGTFGARKGVLSTKMSVRDTGAISKQLNQASHRLVVTAVDRDDDEHADDAPRGLPVSVDDPHNEGALLAVKVGPYERNTVLTPKVIADIRDRGFERMLVRSPIVGGPASGLYSRDLGHREKGGLAPIGDFVGIAASQALSEPLTQAALSEKHSGGVAKGSRPVGPSGFPLIEQYIQVPRTFKGGASHAQEDGKVASIAPAPQGGTYVMISGHNHYIGQGYDPIIKVGQEVEAGDVLSDGLPNPAEIVKHKGVGEGRHYFVNAFVQAYKDAGISVHRRNVEVLARALIDHVELADEMGDRLPGDVVSYNAIEHNYEPRKGHQVVPVGYAKGKYLEQPVLHYSIGTLVRPSVVKKLNEFGVKNVSVHAEPPAFQPRMVRGMENLTHDPDWMTRLLGSYLKRGLLAGAHRGDTSHETGTSFVPSLARAVDFGKAAPLRGWTATNDIPKPPKPAASILAQMNAPPEPEFSKAASYHLPDDHEIFSAEKEHEAGHEINFDDGDDDEPAESLVYPLPQHRMATHHDESGKPMAVFRGSDPKGKSGSFEIHRPGLYGTKTKMYHQCTLPEQDQLLRTFAPLMSNHPRLHDSSNDLAEDLRRFVKKEDA
jgi:hypothetical protein